MNLGLSFGEIVIIFIIAFFVIGPEDLPQAARTLAKLYKKIRGTLLAWETEFEKSVGTEEIKKDFQEITGSIEPDKK